MTDLATLMADCEARDIRLSPDSEDGLTIDAPKDALTPDLIQRLKSHKGDLLAMLRPWPNVTQIPDTSSNGTTTDKAAATKAVCRCGSTDWRDVPIHDGQSIRRECGRCRRFIDFSVWYGKDTLHNE